MQEYWEKARPFLKREWPLLTEVDLDEIGGQYDRLITKLYEIYRGRVEIMKEAAVKGKLQKFLNDCERENL